MPYYFMRDTPLQALEQLMMSQPGQKPRGGGIYRSPFHYTPKDVACEYCQNYVRKHPCRLCECTCLDERIEAGVLELNEFVRDCFAPSMGPQFRKRMHQQLRERNPQFFLSNAHRRRWTYWRERCWRLSDRNKAALFLLTAYESLWRRMVWKCGNDGFDFQSVRLGGIEPELYSIYQAAKAIAIGCCNITLADLASPELVTDESFHLITGALLMAKYLHCHRLCAGIIGGVGCWEQYDFVVSDPCCLRCLFIDSRGGCCQAKQLQNRRALRAVKAAVSAADIVSSNASLLVGGPRQRDQRFLPGHEMGDLHSIAHSIDVRRGGFHPPVDSDAATNTKFESGFFCQMCIRGNTDGQQHHIRMQRLTTLQQGQHGISVLLKSGDGFTQPQSHAVSAHFRMDKARHIRIQRR